ncbi:type II secretion system minor pseudopilin GspI [uncultured Halopseudomonas sp.]|jgi:general secretion pathway protein I|uniref:type II secretion system minor pseudopilin GspI n=1 Tax=uncultured Halopseudomonas sp. TaxID=2901193 RepID=UPI0030EC1B84|tara:strand:- start:5947 stop:6333 length:387 start_codon:yes stop_codon:yes gene_type:complete
MRSRNKGFTLLEVLVAMTILAVALAALVKGGSDHSRNTLYLQERTLAHWAGQNLLAEYETGMRPVAEGNRTGDTVMGPFRYGYQVEISDYTPQAPMPLPAVKRVDIRLWLLAQGEDDQRAFVSGFVLP